MKIIRVFPRRTSYTPNDDYAFVGEPPMIRPDADEVHISVTFTWDLKRAAELALAWGQYYPVSVGGPAHSSPLDGFIPGMYIKQGVTFTSRGCNYNCPWCLVPIREGKLQTIQNFAKGHIIQDNNLLQCNKAHILKVFEMLKEQRSIEFAGGLDSRLITNRVAAELKSLRIHQLFLACDTKDAVKPLRKAVAKLEGLGRRRLRCYVLIAYGGESISEARARLEDVWHSGCLPFAQLYQPSDKYIRYDLQWRELARFWSRPAIMMSNMRNHPRWANYAKGM